MAKDKGLILRIKTMGYVSVLLLILLAVPFAAGPNAQANVNITENLPDLNMKVELSQKDFVLQTQRIEENPGGDDQLKFRVRLPKEWVRLSEKATQSIDLNDRLLGTISKYVSQPLGDKRAQFIVRARELDYLISTKNWLLNYLNERGYTLQGVRQVHANRVEAEYVVFVGGISYGVRAVVQKNGPRIILAEYLAPAGYVESSHDMQVWVTKTFRLLTKGDEQAVSLNEYQLLDFGSFYYPEDWNLVTIGDKAPELTRTRLTKNEKLSDEEKKRRRRGKITGEKGIVQTYFVSKEKLEEEGSVEDYLMKELSESDRSFNRDDFELRKNNNLNKNIENKIYNLSISNGNYLDYQYWMTIQDAPKHKLVTTMITPTPGFSFLDWAKNSATYDMITASFRPAYDE